MWSAVSASSGKRQAKLGGSSELRCVHHDQWSRVMEPTLKRTGAILPVEATEGKGASRSGQRTRFGLVTQTGSGQPAREGEACIGWEGLDPKHQASWPGWKETARTERTIRNLGGPVWCSDP